MKKYFSRREFMEKTAVLGAVSMSGAQLLGGCRGKKEKLSARTLVDVAVAHGTDYGLCTRQAVALLGGMSAFIPRGARVALLANPQRNNPGAYTKPAVPREVIRMCREAGAASIDCISQLPEQNWLACGLKQIVDEEGAGLRIIDRQDETQFTLLDVPRGIALKQAAVMKPLFEYDLFIDIPITKNHAGNRFTGSMKNLMGLTSGNTNRTFHMENWKTDKNAIDHLEQCIADLNTVIAPGLCVVDATEILASNGPFGPGEIVKPRKVVAGTDRVAVDSYCSTLLGLKPSEVLAIVKAQAHGLGRMDLDTLTISETDVS